MLRHTKGRASYTEHAPSRSKGQATKTQGAAASVDGPTGDGGATIKSVICSGVNCAVTKSATQKSSIAVTVISG